MSILEKLKNFLESQKDLIKTGIDIAEANIGHGKNDDKKEFAVRFLLNMTHIPDEIKIGLYDFDVASQIVNIADDVIQAVFDKLQSETTI